MAYTFNTELANVASNYLNLLKVNITNDTIKTSIIENPNYPSLLALSDTFERYNIPNNGFRIDGEKLFGLNFTEPFIAFVNLPNIGSDFILIKEITNKKIVYCHKNNKNFTLSKLEFIKIYKNVIWLAEPNEKSGEVNFEESIKQEKLNSLKKYGLIIGGVIIFSILFLANVNNRLLIPYDTIVIIKIIGLATTIILLLYEIDKNNPFVKSLCGIGKKANCDAVLNSGMAKIGGVSWGEIGFIYFAATSIGLLVPILSFQNKSGWIAIANICAVPYIFFSIYYQWRIVKQWCPLCLTMQFVLFSELLWSIIIVWRNPLPELLFPISYYAVLFSLLLPIILWFTLKPIFIRYKEHDLYKAAYKRLQYNPQVFSNLLEKQEKALDGWQKLGIDIGNPEAENTIIKICNPYCGPCEKSHKIISQILKSSNKFKLKLIYVTRNSENDKGLPVVKSLLKIFEDNNSSKTLLALDNWYLNVDKNIEKFMEIYPFDILKIKNENKIEEMSNWCISAGITHTPTIFLNGFKLPENYTIEELQYIL